MTLEKTNSSIVLEVLLATVAKGSSEGLNTKKQKCVPYKFQNDLRNIVMEMV
jgi:hypothetical protein